MAPRRSSCTRTLNAQPTSAGSSSTPCDPTTSRKRKRGQSVAADETDAKTDNMTRSTSRTKPPSSSSRTRAKPSATGSTPKGRGIVGPERTRGSKALTKAGGAGKLKEVPEVEEESDVGGGDEERERDATPPARKKPCESVEGGDEREEEEAAVRKPSRKGRSRQVVDDEEEETESPPAPAPKTRRSSAKPPPLKSAKATRSSRKLRRLESDIKEGEKGEQEDRAKEEAAIPISDHEDALPVQKGRGRKAPVSKQSQPPPISFQAFHEHQNIRSRGRIQ
ncbi:hypothetical protein OG21DRAFT_1489311 [Imleria badia]|nr:hypothetical protein OG21DRAFT_1489311 [Imleria badia]